jgi:hypothetical protein
MNSTSIPRSSCDATYARTARTSVYAFVRPQTNRTVLPCSKSVETCSSRTVPHGVLPCSRANCLIVSRCSSGVRIQMCAVVGLFLSNGIAIQSLQKNRDALYAQHKHTGKCVFRKARVPIVCGQYVTLHTPKYISTPPASAVPDGLCQLPDRGLHFCCSAGRRLHHKGTSCVLIRYAHKYTMSYLRPYV